GECATATAPREPLAARDCRPPGMERFGEDATCRISDEPLLEGDPAGGDVGAEDAAEPLVVGERSNCAMQVDGVVDADPAVRWVDPGERRRREPVEGHAEPR